MIAPDVIVVGGGPAGSVSAMLLARAGFHVELLDRRVFPRAKACGDCLSPGANRVLQRLGIWERVLAKNPARLQGWSLAYDTTAFACGFAQATQDNESQTGLAISRDRLDHALLDAARDAGVVIRTESRVRELIHDGGRVVGIRGDSNPGPFSLHAPFVIGADGLRSKVARELRAHRRMPHLRKHSFTVHVRGVPEIGRHGEMHLIDGACLGIAAVEDSDDPLCNVTLVLNSRSRVRERGSHRTMRAGLAMFAQRDLSHLVRDDVEILTSGPFDWPTRQIVFSGAALVGDAAGYYDPFTGQGIYQALASAELIAEHVDAALRDRHNEQRHLRSYAQRQRALTRPARRVQYLIEQICARPRIGRHTFRTLARESHVAAQLISVTSDLAPGSALLSPATLAKFAAASISTLAT